MKALGFLVVAALAMLGAAAIAWYLQKAQPTEFHLSPAQLGAFFEAGANMGRKEAIEYFNLNGCKSDQGPTKPL